MLTKEPFGPCDEQMLVSVVDQVESTSVCFLEVRNQNPDLTMKRFSLWDYLLQWRDTATDGLITVGLPFHCKSALTVHKLVLFDFI